MAFAPITPIAASISHISTSPVAERLGSVSGDGTADFLQLLGGALQRLQGSITTADGLSAQLAAGGDVDVHQVMLALESASIGLQTALQVRNKVLDAYQQIMSMPL